MRVAVIDLGSSSFRLVVAEATVGGRIRHVTRKREDVDHLIVVATSALRDDENADEMRERLESRLGQPVRFLSGHQEAALTFAAISAGIDLGLAPALAID